MRFEYLVYILCSGFEFILIIIVKVLKFFSQAPKSLITKGDKMNKITVIQKTTQLGIIIEVYKTNGQMIFTKAVMDAFTAALYVEAINSTVRVATLIKGVK